MSDFDLILKYTEALYACPAESAPRYDEFRDMFSRGQIESKLWLASELKKISPSSSEFVLLGSWFGTLAFILNHEFPEKKIVSVDTDPRCEKFLSVILAHNHLDARWLHLKTQNLHDYPYSSEHVIINTICEHIFNMPSWFQKIPSGTLVLLQSTNYSVPAEHVNCAASLEDFKNQVDRFLDIQFAGKRDLKTYERYMIIGVKK